MEVHRMPPPVFNINPRDLMLICAGMAMSAVAVVVLARRLVLHR